MEPNTSRLLRNACLTVPNTWDWYNSSNNDPKHTLQWDQYWSGCRTKGKKTLSSCELCLSDLTQLYSAAKYCKLGRNHSNSADPSRSMYSRPKSVIPARGKSNENSAESTYCAILNPANSTLKFFFSFLYCFSENITFIHNHIYSAPCAQTKLWFNFIPLKIWSLYWIMMLQKTDFADG